MPQPFLSHPSQKPFVVFGASGQIGRALVQQLGSRALGVSREQVDLANPAQILSFLESVQPCVVLNAAAYTQVDRAEQEESIADAINCEAPRLMARWCAERPVPFVHYSTDYVYSGEGTVPWREDAPASPLSAYGRSKWRGDCAVREAGGDWIIFRTSWVYDAWGKNFFNTVCRLAKERDNLRMVSDQRGAPSYAPDLAEATLTSLEKALAMPDFPRGIYHLCHAGETSWYEFALAIVEGLRTHGDALKVQKIDAIRSQDYPTPAQRPFNSRLALDKIQHTFGIELPHWRTGLERCLQEKQSVPV